MSHSINTKRELIRFLESVDVPEDTMMGVVVDTGGNTDKLMPLHLQRFEMVNEKGKTALALCVVVDKNADGNA